MSQENMADLASVYCPKARSHIVRGGYLDACKIMMEAIRERDIALQKLTPGGSEYVGDPQRCLDYALNLRTRLQTQLKDAILKSREA